MKVNTGSIKITVYGRGKTGKTRFASTFPKPALIIGTEDGTRSVATTPDLHFVQIYDVHEYEELVEGIPDKGFKTVILDTAGGLQDFIIKDILGLDDIPIQRSWGMADQKTWGVIGAQVKERLHSLLKLSDHHGLNAVIIAHERGFRDESEGSELLPSVGPAVSPTVANWLNGACDYICETFIREETYSVVKKMAGKKKEVKLTKKTGKKQYCLRTGVHHIFMTGFRVPDGINVPDSIINPNYEKIVQLIAGEEIQAGAVE